MLNKDIEKYIEDIESINDANGSISVKISYEYLSKKDPLHSRKSGHKIFTIENAK